jgi:hypothetical protein
MDLASLISQYENGEMDDEQTISFFQQLINTGMAWNLQGSYGRMADRLIQSGRCKVEE